MTIKYPDCPQCGNRGWYFQIKLKLPPILTPYDGRKPVNEFPNEVTKEICACEHGRKYKALQDQINHPEYENPFLKMTDNEILTTLDKASKDQNAIDLEFNLDRYD